MSNIYNSQLDAFDLYHIVREIAEEEYRQSHSGSQLPPSGHAVAGSIASALSNALTYPLDLIITRLQTQRRLQKAEGGTEGEKEAQDRQDEYSNLTDAVKKIYAREGGLSGFYAGLLQDTAKTVLDSFLFFLLYNFLREKRLKRFARLHNGKTPSLLPAVDELGIGFVAGSLTRFVTTPISNVVTRKQTGAMAAARRADAVESVTAGEGHGDARKSSGVLSTRDIIRDIHAKKGIKGFWSGYTASLILTLNPSLTFFLFEALKRTLLPRAKRAHPPASATFLLAAISKSIASSVTYPFSLAKARMQAAGSTDDHASSRRPSSGGRHTTILHTVFAIANTEGISSLYEGLSPEILKGFLSHGLTMLVKQGIHNTVLQLYLTLSNLVRSIRQSILGPSNRTRAAAAKTRLRKLRQEAQAKNKEYYDMAIERVGEVAENAATQASDLKDQVVGSEAGKWSGELMQEVMVMANETAELIRDYVDDGEEGE